MFKNKIFEINEINFINYLIIKEDRFRIGENRIKNNRTCKILATKDGEVNYVDEIVSWVVAELTKEPLVIVPYPSTNKDKNLTKQLPYIVAKKMCEHYKGWMDGSGCLIRKYSLPKNTRNEVEQYKSLIVKNNDFLKNKKVLLLDDVTTSGSSLKAGIRIIKKVNPKKIIGLAIAKKVYIKDIPLTGIF